MPFFRPSPSVYQAPPASYAQPTRQPLRSARNNDIYLPPMPEMLQPVKRSPESRPTHASAPSPAMLAIGRGREVIRGQAPEESEVKPIAQLLPPAKLSMPAPEEMGISNAPPAQPTERIADWSAARSRLDELGAQFYRLEKTIDGSYRFACALPQTGNHSQQRQFEAQAASEKEAITLAMQQVEAWSLKSK